MATKRTMPQAALQETLRYFFDDEAHPLIQPVEYWLTSSKAFVRFAQEYRQKIRKKVRTVQSTEELHNVYCELLTAYLLLQERKFDVAYEALTKQHGRSPDFAVTYRTHTGFQVEVTRLRVSQQEQQFAESQGGAASDELDDLPTNSDWMLRHESRRVTHVICDKLGQLRAGTPNVLFLWVQSQIAHEIEVESLMSALKRRVEQRDMDLLGRYGLRNPADFMRCYQRLSAIFVQSLHTGCGEPQVWRNRDTRHPLPPKVQTILSSLVAANDSPSMTDADG